MLARLARQYPAMLRTGFAYMSAYRAEVVIWILSTTMPLIMYAMWASIAREAPIGRFDEAAFASYFLAMLIVRQLSSAYIVWELNDAIRTGRLSMLLVRPVHPLVYYTAEHAGAIPLRAAVLLPLTLLAFALLPGLRFSSEPAHVALALLSVGLAFLLNFLLQALIGLVALYTQQSLSVMDAYFGVWAVLSGYLFPLELIPNLAQVAAWLPFRAMGSLPAEILLGHLDGPGVLFGLGAQLAWLLAAFTALAFAWPRALRRYEAFGS